MTSCCDTCTAYQSENTRNISLRKLTVFSPSYIVYSISGNYIPKIFNMLQNLNTVLCPALHCNKPVDPVISSASFMLNTDRKETVRRKRLPNYVKCCKSHARYMSLLNGHVKLFCLLIIQQHKFKRER